MFDQHQWNYFVSVFSFGPTLGWRETPNWAPLKSGLTHSRTVRLSSKNKRLPWRTSSGWRIWKPWWRQGSWVSWCWHYSTGSSLLPLRRLHTRIRRHRHPSRRHPRPRHPRVTRAARVNPNSFLTSLYKGDIPGLLHDDQNKTIFHGIVLFFGEPSNDIPSDDTKG